MISSQRSLLSKRHQNYTSPVEKLILNQPSGYSNSDSEEMDWFFSLCYTMYFYINRTLNTTDKALFY